MILFDRFLVLLNEFLVLLNELDIGLERFGFLLQILYDGKLLFFLLNLVFTRKVNFSTIQVSIMRQRSDILDPFLFKFVHFGSVFYNS